MNIRKLVLYALVTVIVLGTLIYFVDGFFNWDIPSGKMPWIEVYYEYEYSPGMDSACVITETYFGWPFPFWYSGDGGCGPEIISVSPVGFILTFLTLLLVLVILRKICGRAPTRTGDLPNVNRPL